MTPENINLRDYMGVISKRRRVFVTFFLVTVVLVALGTFCSTPQYEGTTKLLIEKANSNSLTDRDSRKSYNPVDPEFIETQFQLIKSKNVGLRVVEILSLEQTYDDYLGKYETSSILHPIKSWVGEIKVSAMAGLEAIGMLRVEIDPPQSSRRDQLAEIISSSIEVSPIANSRIVEISYESPNPEFAALIANTVTKAYMDTALDMKMEVTTRNLGWMTKKAEVERRKLEQSEKDLPAYMRANNLVTLEDRIAVIPQKLSEVSIQLVRAQGKRTQLESLFNKVNDPNLSAEAAESILAITSGNTLQTLRDQILKAEQQVRELSGKFGSKHPAMIKANGDLDILKSKKTQEVNRLIASVKNEYYFSVSDEQNLRQQLEKIKEEAHDLNEKFIQYGGHKRELETSLQLYDALLLQMKEMSIVGETLPVNLWIVEKASVPLFPSKPRKTINLLMGLAIGLFGAVGLTFFVEYLDQSIIYQEETEQALGIPVLGMVGLLREKDGHIEKIMIDQPRSAIAEHYRALRTSLLLSNAKEPPRTVLISGVGVGVGKSTTAYNLALAVAQSGKRVLLIDADMRKPTLEKLFDLKTGPGLSTYLTGGAGFQGGTIVVPHPVEKNLALIPSGPIPANPSDLLMSGRMQSMLKKLSSSYDLIVCDSPPLQSAVDALILSKVFDGTVVVVKGRHTTFNVARKALKLIRDVDSPVFGLVINALEFQKHDNYYSSYYGASVGEPQKA